MPFFYLEPKHGDTSDPSWEATYLKQGCWTEAATEDFARQRVAGVTLRMVSRKPGHLMRVHSPWVQSSLTDCKIGEPPRDIPKGKVLTQSGKIFDN